MTLKQLEKLDRKVAEALGWTKFGYERLNYKDKNLKFLNKPRLIGLAPGNLRKQCVPHYTTNLVYSWDCVKWARKHDIVFDILLDPTRKEVRVRFLDEWGKYGIAFHEAPSMAICLAFIDLNRN